MNKRILAPIFVFVFALAAGLPTFAQDKPKPKKPTLEQEAMQLVKRYMGHIKAKAPKKALDLWDFERFCKAVFGADFDAMSAADKTSCVKELRSLLEVSFTDPRVVDWMSNAKVSDFKVGKTVKGKVEVRFKLTPPQEGSPPVAQFMWIERVGKAVRVVDIANTSADRCLQLQLGAQWKKAKGREAPNPLAYVRLMGGKR